jgi:enoyl-CoA hydratase/carnithine racemase
VLRRAARAISLYFLPRGNLRRPEVSVVVQRAERPEGGWVAHVTIDNRAKLNSLNRALMSEIVATLRGLTADAQLRLAVVSGAGERAFVGGADIGEIAALDRATARGFIALVHECCDAFRCLPVPVIARIDGWTLGAGLELACACDLRVASARSMFGMPEVRIGIPSVVEAALLPRLIGQGRARRLLLTGEPIGAAEALAWGLVDVVVAPAGLDDAVERLVRPILAAGPRAVRLQKSLILDWEDLPLTAAVERGIECFVAAFDSDEPARMAGAMLAELRSRRR